MKRELLKELSNQPMLSRKRDHREHPHHLLLLSLKVMLLQALPLKKSTLSSNFGLSKKRISI